MSGLLGKKMGMTQYFDETGDVVPVTVIQAGPCTVVQKRTVGTDGYEALQLGFEELAERKANKPQKNHFAKKNLKPFRYLKEFKGLDASLEVGQLVSASLFQVGELVKVTGVSKGKGFAGVIKRHHKAGGPATHGSRFHRTTGSIGQRTSPGEVFKNMKLPGHLGDVQVTVRHLEVVQIRPEQNLLFIKGAVPGARNNLLVIQK